MDGEISSSIGIIPWEIIECILQNDNLELLDIFNFGLTCRYFFKTLCVSNKVWRCKFFQRWPNLRETYGILDRNGSKVSNWMREVYFSIESRRNLVKELSLMSQKHYKKQELADSALINIDTLFRRELGAHPQAYHFLIDELITLIQRTPLTSNLTQRYYAYRVIRYLRQSYVAIEWENFMGLPVEKQTLERGAVLVSQWSQPEKRILHSNVSLILDRIAECTKQNIFEHHPTHPIFSVPFETYQEWRDTNINNNQWNPTASRQVLNTLCKVMFGKMGFYGNSEMYYSSINSFIDQVLEHKRGIPITLAIIFESVARRLGLRCEPVSFPAHFLLRWTEDYAVSQSSESPSFYIDVFNGGQFLTKNSCPRIRGSAKCPIEQYNIYQCATAIEVVQRMASNLEVAGRQRTQLNGRTARLRSALELLHMVRPYDTTTILHLARFYMLHEMNLSNLADALTTIQTKPEMSSRGHASQILQMLEDYERRMSVTPQKSLQPKKRTSQVKFAVGMIMRHQTHRYICVITGWDLQCEASSEWMDEMGIGHLSDGANQPFYNLLVDDGSSRYAAQENLLMTSTPKWINHDEIGRYFYQYCGTYYLPNEEKEREYPSDGEIRYTLVGQ